MLFVKPVSMHDLLLLMNRLGLNFCQKLFRKNKAAGCDDLKMANPLSIEQ
jgi:hypothetical protein